jgi:translation initiation factor 2 beta subunit (eIF-2beta)/eIF-5
MKRNIDTTLDLEILKETRVSILDESSTFIMKDIHEQDATTSLSQRTHDASLLKWDIQEEILCYEDKWYISSSFLRRALLQQNHDDSQARHFEYTRTLELLRRKYYWSKINNDIKEYVETYSTCHRVKTVKHKSFNQLQSLFLLKDSRRDWIMNFIINLSLSKRWKCAFDSILILMNRYFKYARYIRSRMNWSVEQLVDALVEEFHIKLKVSESIITNRESLFTSHY